MVALPLVTVLVAAAPHLDLRTTSPVLERCAFRRLLDAQLKLLGGATLSGEAPVAATLRASVVGGGLALDLDLDGAHQTRALDPAGCETWARLTALFVDRLVHEVRWSGSTSLNTAGNVAAPTPDIPTPRPPRADASLPDAGAPLPAPRPTDSGDGGAPSLAGPVDGGPQATRTTESASPSFSGGVDRGTAVEIGSPSAAAGGRPTEPGPPPPMPSVDGGTSLLSTELLSRAGPPPPPPALPPPPARVHIGAGYGVVLGSEGTLSGPALTAALAVGLFFVALDGMWHALPPRSSPVVLQGASRGLLAATSGAVRAVVGLCFEYAAFSLCGGPSATLWLQQASSSGSISSLSPGLEAAALLGAQLRPALTVSLFSVSLLLDGQGALLVRRAAVDGTTVALSTPSWAFSASLFMGLRIP